MKPDTAATLIVLGAGGHGRVVADAALASRRWASVLASDADPARCQGELLPGVACVPMDEALRLAAAGAQWHVAIGQAQPRQRVSAQMTGAGGVAACVVHPGAHVAPRASLGPGCFVGAAAVVAPGALLGQGVIVNHAAVVDHDCRVGDFTHIAPRGVMGGAAQLGARTLLGAGAVVLPGVRVCDDATIGAQALVRAAILEPGTYAGVPARRIR